jgi:hypothetical protein
MPPGLFLKALVRRYYAKRRETHVYTLVPITDPSINPLARPYYECEFAWHRYTQKFKPETPPLLIERFIVRCEEKKKKEYLPRG